MNKLSEAVELMNNQNFEQAIELLEGYYDRATDDEKYTIGEIYQNWGFLDYAERIFQYLLTKYDETELRLSLAQIYIDQERDEQAIQLLNEIDGKDPHYLSVLVQLADLYYVQGLHEVAETKLIEAKQLDPEEIIIDFALGELYFSIGQYGKCISYYERVQLYEQTMNNISIHERLAEAYAAVGKYEKALTYYETLQSDEPDTMFKHGLTAFQAKETSIAIHQWKKLLEKDKFYHTVYYHLAEAYEAEGYISEAYEIAVNGLSVDEYNKELYFLAGKLAQELGYMDDSISYIQEAVVLDPDYKEAVLYLVDYYKANDDQEQIIELISDFKNIGVQDPLYDLELARAYIEVERYDEAEKQYANIYNALKHQSDFLKEYAYFLVEEGKINEALKLFDQYLIHEPDDFEMIQYVDRLRGEDF